MKKIAATLIAGLFVTAAFAQTTAGVPSTPSATPAATDAAAAKTDTKADTKTATSGAQQKKAAHHHPMKRAATTGTGSTDTAGSTGATAPATGAK